MFNRLARDLLLLIPLELPAYYVSTSSGNDTTGDGTAGTPWATISKALATVPLTGNVNVLVDAGTYAEDTGAAGYLNITRTFSDWVNVKPWHAGDAVIITDNASGSYSIRYAGGQKVRFYNVTMQQAGANSEGTVVVNNGGIADFVGCTVTSINYGIYSVVADTCTITASNCTITPKTGATGNVRAVYARSGNGGNQSISLYNCICSGIGTTLVAAIDAGLSHAAGLFNLVIDGGSYTGTSNYAVRTHGGTMVIRNATVTSTSAPALVFGTDGGATYATTGSAYNCTVTCGSSHAMLVGQQCSNVTVDAMNVTGGDYGLVLKHCDSVSVTNSTLINGTTSPLYFKAATNTSVTGCTINSSVNYAVLIQNDVTNVQNLTLTGNTITATGTAKCLFWPDATQDDGGGVCDSNVYDYSASSANLGDVRGTADITTLVALQGAWSGYDNPNNDANSTVFS